VSVQRKNFLPGNDPSLALNDQDIADRAALHTQLHHASLYRNCDSITVRSWFGWASPSITEGRQEDTRAAAASLPASLAMATRQDETEFETSRSCGGSRFEECRA
jgi:hypothetical protein